MPAQPRNIASTPTPAKRQPIKPVKSGQRKPPEPLPPAYPSRSVQPPSWRSQDGRLRVEDRGFAMVVFSDGRPAGELTEEDAVNLMGALALATMRRKAKRGELDPQEGAATDPPIETSTALNQVGSGDTTGTNQTPPGGTDGPDQTPTKPTD